MSDHTPEEVLAELHTLAESWTGSYAINHVYDELPESINEPGPVMLIYLGNANHSGSTCSPMDRMTTMETPVMELLYPRAMGITAIMTACKPFLSYVPKAILSDAALGPAGLVFAVNSIERKFPWQRKHDGIDHLGVRWDVKVRMDSSLT
jgi:hypothetical protein